MSGAIHQTKIGMRAHSRLDRSAPQTERRVLAQRSKPPNADCIPFVFPAMRDRLLTALSMAWLIYNRRVDRNAPLFCEKNRIDVDGPYRIAVHHNKIAKRACNGYDLRFHIGFL